MAIASWSGPNRKHKEISVSMKEEEVISAASNYIDLFSQGKMPRGEAIKAIQLTLGLCFGLGYNFRLAINSAITEIEKEPKNRESILENLMKTCKQQAKD